VSSVNPE